MLSEQQALRLLDEVERQAGKSLGALRTNLLRNRNTESALWELVVLYVAQNAYGTVEHEPGDGQPDVIVSSQRMALEAHVVFSKQNQISKLSHEFDVWIYKQLVKEGISIHSRYMATELLDSEEEGGIPQQQNWRALTKEPEWRSFVESIKTSGSGVWILPRNNIRIVFKLTESRYSSGRPFTPKASSAITDSSVYKAIKQKGRQIRKWSDDVLSVPIVLVICAPEPDFEFNDSWGGSGGSRSQAIWSALLNPKKLNAIDAYNLLGVGSRIDNGTLKPPDFSNKVSGAGKISAVVFVQLESSIDYRNINRKANVTIYPNFQADTPLSDAQLDALKSMDFSLVDYGPGWESWQEGQRDSMTTRNLKRSGGWCINGMSDNGFAIEIPAISLVQVLSGLKTAEAAFGDRSDPPNPLWMCAKALEENREITVVKILESDDQRDERKVLLEFGPPRDALLAEAKPK